MKTRSAPADLDENLKSDCCRICLTPNMNMNNIFSGKLLENIKYCTGITIKRDNRLPTQICKRCLRSLVVAHKFKKLCLLTEQICKNLLQGKIKGEPPDNNNILVGIESDDDKDHFNGDHGKMDHFYESHEKKDHFNENVIEDNFNKDHVEEDHLIEDLNEDDFEDSHINDDDDANVTNNLSALDDDLTIVKKEEVTFDELSTEDVQSELFNSLEIKSKIETPRRQRKRRKSAENCGEGKVAKKKKRGPYKKKGTLPVRRKKFKFIKLFCETCQIKFTSKMESDQHREKVHKEPWSFMCEVCGKMFVHRGSHYAHLRSHLPPTHACSDCDYRTSNKYDLAKHLLIHAGIKKWQCSRCPNNYHTVSNLREHERMVHERLKRYACNICGKMFYDRTHLHRHVDSHNDIKRHECDVCHAAFSRRCHWKKHLLKQHSIVIPAQRPGRKNNLFLGHTSVSLNGQTGNSKPD